jgi:D-alanine-D-alanine ligase
MKTMLVIFGGQSPEHEISIRSFFGVFSDLPKDWKKVPVYIERNGMWSWMDARFLTDPKSIPSARVSCGLMRQGPGWVSLVHAKSGEVLEKVDFVFPILHGEYGEDGRIQGWLDMLGVPYAGCGMEASAISMNKWATKVLCQHGGVPIVPTFPLTRVNHKSFNPESLPFLLPWFVKPARTGSSVGVSRVNEIGQLNSALEEAFLYDSLVLIEKGILGREMECSVLEDVEAGTLITSEPAEIIPGDVFYSYKDKYLDDKAKILCPADLSPSQKELIQNYAATTFRLVGGRGYARVDFLLDNQGSVFLNEINTIPGFTSISMFPKMLEVSGFSRKTILQKIVQASLSPNARSPMLSH